MRFSGSIRAVAANEIANHQRAQRSQGHRWRFRHRENLSADFASTKGAAVDIYVPQATVQLAHLLGYFVGDGNITKSGICLTCGDGAYAQDLADLLGTTLEIPVTLRDDRTETGPRWRIEAHSRELLRLLEAVGINLEARAATKEVPDAVLRSPKRVMSAFLSGYFDADAYAGKAGIILSSVS